VQHTEDSKIDVLKNLLLNEDRLEIDALKQQIERLENLIETQDALSEKVNPIITKRLDKYTEDIPKKLGPSITESLSNEIANSQDAIVDALYPIMGKLIKKYILKEFEKLSEQINNQIKNRFSFKGFGRKLKSIFTGVNEDSLIIKDIAETKIEELFIIEKNSGILKGNFSKTNTIDKDVLSGMLTAIKSFVEDAIKTDNDNLESIEYGLYHIHIQNFKSYYIAAIVHGVYDTNYQENLRDLLYDFSKKHYKASYTKTQLSQSLEKMFGQ
jgi:hypothetical protein